MGATHHTVEGGRQLPKLISCASLSVLIPVISRQRRILLCLLFAPSANAHKVLSPCFSTFLACLRSRCEVFLYRGLAALHRDLRTTTATLS